jgi:integrase
VNGWQSERFQATPNTCACTFCLRFEKLALTEITWDKTLDLLQKLEVDDSLGHHTLTHVRACISTVLTDAVTVRLLKQNPLLGQRRKASRKHRAETIQPKRPLNWAQKAKFEATIDKLLATGWRLRPSYAVHHLLQLHCGLRPSESAVLKVSDIDLEKSCLRIERALDEDGTIKATKTHEQRWVDLNTWIKDRLKLHVTWLKAEAIAAGKSVEWLLPSEAWTFLNERNARRAFDAICDEANKSDDGIKLEGHSPYDLRHTFASLQLSAGADPAYVSAQMGHANTEITLTVYTKWVRTEGRRFVDLLAERDSTGIADQDSPVMTPPSAPKPLK